jgi:hypothetical protein
MKTINDIVTKTATRWKFRAKKDRKNRILINLKNKTILLWLSLKD